MPLVQAEPAPFAFAPIGVVRSPFHERAEAPRQPVLAEVDGRIELYAGHGYEHALEGLDRWERVWVLFVFHKNIEQGRGWRPKVLPPRSAEKRGVFATRSPHRPNPIGLSVMRVGRVDGLTVHVIGVDLLDETPVLDIKPYVAYADAHPAGKAGWLADEGRPALDPGPRWHVTFAPSARAQLDWLNARGVGIEQAVASTLALGPQPHAYRRIRARPDGKAMTLAVKDWRIDFSVSAADGAIVVAKVRTGYRARELLLRPELELHRSFSDAFE
jgi:tRNA-Thr(GGU) m(6)t(6)A37 methyltransferase TsaA